MRDSLAAGSLGVVALPSIRRERAGRQGRQIDLRRSIGRQHRLDAPRATGLGCARIGQVDEPSFSTFLDDQRERTPVQGRQLARARVLSRTVEVEAHRGDIRDRVVERR